MRPATLSLAIVVALSAASAIAGQGNLRVNKATYGVLGSGPSCDATASLRQQCDGRDGCQVAVDPRYLCPDPALRREKSVVVNYSCNGKTETLSFPDGAQLALRCASTGGGGGSTARPGTSTTTPGNIGGGTPPSAGQIPSIAGRWVVSSGNSVGDLVFSVSGNQFSGNIYANLIPGGNSIQGTINGARVEFDRNSVAHQHWSGTVDPSGTRISGVVTYPGGSQPWTATRR